MVSERSNERCVDSRQNISETYRRSDRTVNHLSAEAMSQHRGSLAMLYARLHATRGHSRAFGGSDFEEVMSVCSAHGSAQGNSGQQG